MAIPVRNSDLGKGLLRMKFPATVAPWGKTKGTPPPASIGPSKLPLFTNEKTSHFPSNLRASFARVLHDAVASRAHQDSLRRRSPHLEADCARAHLSARAQFPAKTFEG